MSIVFTVLVLVASVFLTIVLGHVVFGSLGTSVRIQDFLCVTGGLASLAIGGLGLLVYGMVDGVLGMIAATICVLYCIGNALALRDRWDNYQFERAMTARDARRRGPLAATSGRNGSLRVEEDVDDLDYV